MHSLTELQLKNIKKDLLEVGIIGKTVGLKGKLKLHNKSDFPMQFKKGSKFYLKNLDELIIKSYDSKQSLVDFENFEDINLAKSLVNKVIYSTKEDTIKNCKLSKEEYFYFDIIGLEVIEDNQNLGKVIDIMEASLNSFLHIQSSEAMLEEKLAKEFFIPYTNRYIQEVDLVNKNILVKNSKEILLNS